MTSYLYPQNLKATASLWLWGMKDFIILCIGVLISVPILLRLGVFLPAVLTLGYGFVTIRLENITILDFIKYALRYFVTSQQYYEWQ